MPYASTILEIWGERTATKVQVFAQSFSRMTFPQARQCRIVGSVSLNLSRVTGAGCSHCSCADHGRERSHKANRT